MHLSLPALSHQKRKDRVDKLNRLVIDHIDVDVRELVLSRGTISELDTVDAIDYLLISSRSKDYDPAQGGWVAELYEAGISVEALEREPALDLRPLLPCWISKEIIRKPGHYFKRLVVFEPIDPAESAAKDVWVAFQALRLFAGESAGADADIRVAAPVLSSFAGEEDFSVMLRMIFFAATSLAARGRWGYITIIVPDERADQASTEFASLKSSYLSPPFEPEHIKALVAPIKAQYEHAHRVERLAHAAELGLTERQAIAIYYYTVQSYIFVNRALRQEDVTDPEFMFFQPFIEALSSGLAALVNHISGTRVSRNIAAFPGVEDLYKVSNIVREAAYTSTTLNEMPVAQDYKIMLKGQIGKSIEVLSHYPQEREVLFDRTMLHLISHIEDVYWESAPGIPASFRAVTTDEMLANTSNIHFSCL